MTPKEAIARLDELPGDQREGETHESADNVLCLVLRHLGHGAVVDAYERLQNRSTFWYS